MVYLTIKANTLFFKFQTPDFMERLIDITQFIRELSDPIELDSSLIEFQSSSIQLQCSLYVYN